MPLRASGDKIEASVRAVVKRGTPLTYDLVGEEKAAKMSEVTSAILKELDAGTPATELARRHGIHANTIRLWRGAPSFHGPVGPPSASMWTA